MALKDLITKRAVMAEEQIEEIVSQYVGYDVDEKSIVPKAPFASLSNKQKVLIYLVALQGWPFVTKDEVLTSASPSELEKALRIPGGSLRPMLVDLKERHVIVGGGKSYAVSAVHLDAVKKEIGSGRGDDVQTPARPKRARRKARAKAPDGATALKKPRRSERKATSRAERFDAWIKDGFFNEPRTLNEVHARFRKEAQNVRKTSVPQYLLRAVDAGRLEREQKEINGKLVWVYQKH
ncbi:MAG: hypothetical protein L0210_01680 [Rhodospirillales bacterium]|nr:hypothetical protein [Rhodospirillales bacterium]